MSGSPLIVGPEAMWIRLPSGEQLYLVSRRPMRQMLWALTETALNSPGERLSRDDLREAGWPGEAMDEQAARNRVYVAVAGLRREGLRGILKSDAGGYWLEGPIQTGHEAADTSSTLEAEEEAEFRSHFALEEVFGREPELERVRELMGADPGGQVWLIWGPGGVGKSTLLSAIGELVREAGHPFVRVDARYISPSPESFRDALMAEGSYRKAQQSEGFWVLAVDTFEQLAALEPWIRQVFSLELPGKCLLILSGRQDLSSAWKTDVAWSHAVQCFNLQPFSSEEADRFLDAREIEQTLWENARQITRNLPLALAMVAESLKQDHSESNVLSLDPGSDLIQRLMSIYLEGVTDVKNRRLLELASVVRSCNEDLIDTVLDFEDSTKAMDWLSKLSFTFADSHGVVLHDLARDALLTDLRWRSESRFHSLRERAHEHLAKVVRRTKDPRTRLSLTKDLLHLHIQNPAVGPFFEWDRETGWMESADPEDHAAATAIVRKHEGDESAAIFQHWLKVQPNALHVCRSSREGVNGLALWLNLDRLAPEDWQLKDPGVETVMNFLRDKTDFTEGDDARFLRYWMSADAYRMPSAATSHIMVQTIQTYLTPGLTYSFVCHNNPEFWEDIHNYTDIPRVPEADFSVGGQSFGTFWHDWRTIPVERWIERFIRW
ncbi:MAG: hypothetical protein KC561_04195 [Myxococcales bacterium]|nr:hypothetical protein [Myxococcales bacterium]